ncbi:MAG TPA: helix-turn-helix transcriptional regulator [Chloroflexia bacterium]|jgi:transcriptional regulator with XRE-family HTH domain|nr:helix-turn-helix transcriptional regulator [Chloroflexia bacterium]
MIGPVVKNLRLERGLSQESLAGLAHVSSGYLSKLERGLYKEPSYEVLSRIANALEMPTARLYKAAGMEHLLAEADPNFEPVANDFAPKLADLPKRDRALILTEIRRVMLEESEGGES